MEWKEILHWAFESIATAVGVYIASKASEITKSIQGLNLSVSTLLERSTNQEKRIDRLEQKSNGHR